MTISSKEFLIEVRADIRSAVAEMRQLSGELKNTERGAKATDRAVRGLERAAKGAAAAFTAYLSLRTAVDVLATADAYGVLDTRIRTATKATGDYVAVNGRLREISSANGIALQTTVELFQSIARTAPELEASNAEVLRLVNLVQQLGRIGGSSQAALDAGLLQFTQGLQGGVFRAEEFNSILENLPELASRIAQGLGVSVGQLRGMVLEGRLLSRDVFDVLLQQSGDIQAEFDGLGDTLGAAGTDVKNAFGAALGDIDRAYGLTAVLAEALRGVASGIRAVGSAVLPDTADDLRQEIAALNEELEGITSQSAAVRILDNIGRIFTGRAHEIGLALHVERLREELAELDRQAARDARSVEARFGSGQSRSGGADPAKAEAARKLAEDTQTMVKALELQAATLGMSAERVALYQLALKGASAEQLAAARAAVTTIEAYNQQEEAAAAAARAEQEHEAKLRRVIEAAREAADPWARYREELELLEEAQERGLNPEVVRARVQQINEAINGIADQTERTTSQMSEFARQAARDMQSAFSGYFFSILQGETDDLGKRFKAMLDRMAADLLASQLLRFLLGDFGVNGSMEIGGLIGAAFSGGGGSGGADVGSQQLAGGGLVVGPGSGTSDDVNIWASNGEYMLRASAVQRYGLPMLDAINSETFPGPSVAPIRAPRTHYADGGLVVGGAGAGAGGGTVQNFYISTPDAQSFRRSEGALGRDAAAALQRQQQRNR